MSEHDPATPPAKVVKGRRVRHGLVIVNTGEGKGKTTAALGVIFRAWGRDFKIRMFQFIKHTGARFGEHRAAALAVEQWDHCKNAILTSDEDIIVLDEFTYAMHYGWIPVSEVVETLQSRRDTMHVIITGRYAPQELIDCADLVTEMKLIKHPYQDKGIKAQRGIEF